MKKLLACLLLAIPLSASAGYETLLEKLSNEIKTSPYVICIKDQCNYITYSNDGDQMVVASTQLHGKTFYGWAEPCPWCVFSGSLVIRGVIKYNFIN